ncbi:MAG TPA: hypothetical protein VFH99_03860 [Candidatus Saccharimonadales bacterium]|nr:hypothetical protein [Candidatus Saccharimonadales bacterium]
MEDPNSIDHLERQLREPNDIIPLSLKAKVGLFVLSVPGAVSLGSEVINQGTGDLFRDAWAGSCVMGVIVLGGGAIKELWQRRNPELKHEL